MAHFAHLVNAYVRKVHVVANEVITDKNGVEQEKLGKSYLSKLWGYSTKQLVQCSYNGNFRGVYPGPGFTYDSKLDQFIAPIVEEVLEPDNAAAE